MRFVFDDHLREALRRARADARSTDDVAERERALLVSGGMGPLLYLTEDGRVLSDSSDDGGPPLGEASDDEAVSTIVFAAERFRLPELLDVLPKPPPGAAPCSECGGRRWSERPTRMVCFRCAGRGFTIDWASELRAHARACRAASPISDASRLAARAREEYAVEGGYLQTWLNEHAPKALAARAALPILGLAPDPAVVISGDEPCLAALALLTRGRALVGEGRVVGLLEAEYADFLRRRPEPKPFDRHLHAWSYFVDAPAETLERARRLGRSIDPRLSFRSHVTGVLWGPRQGHETHSLWSWDGRALALVEEVVAQSRF